MDKARGDPGLVSFLLLGGDSIFVMTLPPGRAFAAAKRRAVEPLIHAPQCIQSARIGGIGLIDRAVLHRKSAHARPVPHIGGRICAAGSRELLHRLRQVHLLDRMAAAAVIIFRAARTLL